MRPVFQLGIGAVSASLATAITIHFHLYEHPLGLAALLLVACCAAPLLSLGSTTKPEVRDTAPAAGGREVGQVKWFNVTKGFGFIRRENGEEVFVHFRSLKGPARERRNLKEGQKVSFVVAQSEKGPQAEEVEAVAD